MNNIKDAHWIGPSGPTFVEPIQSVSLQMFDIIELGFANRDVIFLLGSCFKTMFPLGRGVTERNNIF